MRYARPVLAGCAAAGIAMAAACTAQDPAPVTGSPSASESATLEPTPSTSTSGPISPRYAMTADSFLTVVDAGPSMPAASGTIVVTNQGNSTQIVATGLAAPRKRLPPVALWTLDLTISSSGRAESGTITVGTQSWEVVTGSGILGSVVTTGSVRFWTIRAVTGTTGTPASNTPVTFNLAGTS